MKRVIKPSLWMLMLSVCGCQTLTGGDDFKVVGIDDNAIMQAGVSGAEPKGGTGGVMPKAGAGGDEPKAGTGGDPKAGSGGGGHAGVPMDEPCERSISGAPCNLAPNCGCEDDKSCALTGANGSTPTLACVTPGPMGPGSVCKVQSDCGEGLTCLGGARGVCRPYCDDDNDCFGDGICSPILNDGVALDGARACFQRCETNNDCATDCCIGNKCADATLCEPVPLGGSCTTTSVCDGAATGDAACVGGICKPTGCSVDGDCSTGCCKNSMCVAEAMCDGTVAIGGLCDSNGECKGFRAGETGCMNFTGEPQGRCAARCTNNAGCNSMCCVDTTTENVSFCGPVAHCEPTPPPPPQPLPCRETGTECQSNGDCCDFASGEALCVALTEDLAGCAAICDAHSDCQSGCCAETANGRFVCAPDAACN